MKFQKPVRDHKRDEELSSPLGPWVLETGPRSVLAHHCALGTQHPPWHEGGMQEDFVFKLWMGEHTKCGIHFGSYFYPLVSRSRKYGLVRLCKLTKVTLAMCSKSDSN